MKIAVISMIRNSWGGSEELWYDMAKLALNEGHEVIHLCYEHKNLHPKMKELIDCGLTLMHRPGITNHNLRGLRRLSVIAVNFLRKRIQNPFKRLFRLQPDVILYNGTCYSIAKEKQLVLQLRNFHGRFFLLGHYNEAGAPATGKIAAITAAYQRAEKVLFTNHRDIRNARTHLGYEIPNAMVVRNPVNMADKTILPFPGENIAQMAMVANLIIQHKGQDIVLTILKKQPWQEREFRLNIYGDGPDEKLLKDLCVQNNLQEKVAFHGRVDDIRAVWRQNHILLMPSRMEGMPLALVEAMLCGRPSVATNVGGIADWLEEDRSGFIADQPTETSFEISLEKAWQNKFRWQELGKQAHERAVQLYDPAAGKTLLELMTK